MDADFEVLLFYTAVRWLSKGNTVNRFFDLREEVELFLEIQGKAEYLSHFKDEMWVIRVAYLADIFSELNKVNLKLQGKATNIIQFKDEIIFKWVI